MADSRINDYTQGSVARNIISMALPMTMAQLINVLYSVVDRVYIGWIPGTDGAELTGLGLTLPIITILMGFANLCGMGGGPLCSIHRGRGEDEEAEYVMGNSFILLLGFGVAAAGLIFLLKEPFAVQIFIFLIGFAASVDDPHHGIEFAAFFHHPLLHNSITVLI